MRAGAGRPVRDGGGHRHETIPVTGARVPGGPRSGSQPAASHLRRAPVARLPGQSGPRSAAEPRASASAPRFARPRRGRERGEGPRVRGEGEAPTGGRARRSRRPGARARRRRPGRRRRSRSRGWRRCASPVRGGQGRCGSRAGSALRQANSSAMREPAWGPSPPASRNAPSTIPCIRLTGSPSLWIMPWAWCVTWRRSPPIRNCARRSTQPSRKSARSIRASRSRRACGTP